MADRGVSGPAASAPALHSVPIFSSPDQTTAADAGAAGLRSGSPWLRPGDAASRHDQGRRVQVGERAQPPADRWAEVDWAQVVLLRKQASEVITAETQSYLSEHGRPMPAEDRRLMGRAIIRRVVNDHVRALHREGSALWSPETERTYVHTYYHLPQY